MTIIRWVCALALALMPACAVAQVASSVKAQSPAGYLPAGANFCSNDSGVTWVPCPTPVGGGGSGGAVTQSGTWSVNLGTIGGAATAAKQDAIQTVLDAMNTRIGNTTSPAAGSTNYRLGELLAAFSNAATSALQSTGNASLVTIAATSGTNGSPAPTAAQAIGGTDGTALRSLRTDNRGGLAPAQGVATSTRVTLTASTATSLSGAAAGRIGLAVQVEAVPSANVYLCTTQTTACSATLYDAIIPAGAAAGSSYTFLFAPSSALYAYSTGTPIIISNSWVAP